MCIAIKLTRTDAISPSICASCPVNICCVAFKPGKTLFVASADFLRTNNRQPGWAALLQRVISEYPPEMLDIEMLFIDCVKIAINHVDYLKLINQCAYLFFIHGVSCAQNWLLQVLQRVSPRARQRR